MGCVGGAVSLVEPDEPRPFPHWGYGESSWDGHVCIVAAFLFFTPTLTALDRFKKMGKCGITTSKTVLVFLNMIFWVSWGCFGQFFKDASHVALQLAAVLAAPAEPLFNQGGIYLGRRENSHCV